MMKTIVQLALHPFFVIFQPDTRQQNPIRDMPFLNIIFLSLLHNQLGKIIPFKNLNLQLFDTKKTTVAST